MQTLLLKTSDPNAIERALGVLNSGGLVAFPTDTVYGVGALANHPGGIERLYQAKDRSTNKAIAVLIGDPAQLDLLTLGLTPSAQLLAAHYWPGALTLVVPRRNDLPHNLSSLPTIGVRMPDHAFALALMGRSGPLATSSANLSGQSDPRTAEEVMAQLEGRVELILDGGPVPGGVPSTVVDCTQDSLRILRKGAIPEEAIVRLLRPN
jgi:L-threonylcarbamoyladenylate synthase